jgi:hypothetical protein
MINKSKSLIISGLKKILPYIIKAFGIKMLSKNDTKIGLSSFLVSTSNKYQFDFKNLAEDNTSIKSIDGTSPSNSVYLIKNINFSLLPYCGLKIDKNVFDLDFGNSLIIKYFFSEKRKLIKVQTCIVLWSHEWGTGYFDFMYFILLKLNKILINAEQLALKDTVILVPFNTSELPDFAFEYFSLFGFDKSKIVDSKRFKVIAEKYYFGDNNSFFFPNFFDVLDLKNYLHKKLSIKLNSSERSLTNIYLRRSGKRKVKNEEEIIPILEKHNFKIIDDSPKSISEQFKLFQSAKIVLGPHGAGFSNILFCKKNTKVIEFFSGNYYPPYYFYLSGILGFDYYGIVENEKKLNSHYSNVGQDLTINKKKLDELLTQIC